MNPLNPLELPLNQTNLIEASAGTGKTYTIGSLYLRLLLQEKRKVEEILVVTFTEIATQDLKRKIRERLTEALVFLQAYQAASDNLPQDPFLTPLIASLEDVNEGIRRLEEALQNLDLAAIFTIHGFCRRMLMQHAFYSGVHFNLQLVKDSSDLYRQLAEELWRRYFYHLSVRHSAMIAELLGSPESLLAVLKPHIGRQLVVNDAQAQALGESMAEFLPKLADYEQSLQEIKHFWLAQSNLIEQILEQELAKKYSGGEAKSLKRQSYKRNLVTKWVFEVNAWAQDENQWQVAKKLPERFTQSALALYAEEGAMPLEHQVFADLEAKLAALPTIDFLQKGLQYHYLNALNRGLLEYRTKHVEKGFDDLLRLLQEALEAAHGKELAALIRRQYPFAMIDEFQDTDGRQYAIFSKIYREKPQDEQIAGGFMMIGDPKQAIYRFRGADIFTYLAAAKEADACFNLGKNYRSEAHLVQAVNRLFDFPNAPFIYPSIRFLPVSARDDVARFTLRGAQEPALRCYISDSDDAMEHARAAAIAIQQWLNAAAEGQAHFGDKPLLAENIAVLVRDRYEAGWIKSELQKLGVASVYLSEQSSVFDSPVAAQLALILKACLNVGERSILNAIGTALFALNAAEIRQIHQDENQWQKWADAFSYYQRLWQRQGILAMLQQLLLREHICERLLARPDGERQLTDLLHLAELLQQAAALQESAAALLHWFEKQIRDDGRQEAQIRLESERQLVKIVSVHKSKGLEYDLVCLPFLWRPARTISKNGLHLYYDKGKEQICWDMQNQHQQELAEELFAEELRLLYVALTRAKYQMLLTLPATFTDKWNALLYTLTQGEIATQQQLSQTYSSAELVAQFARGQEQEVQIQEASTLQAAPPIVQKAENKALSARVFEGHIEQNWHIISFSALEQGHLRHVYLQENRNSAFDFGMDATDYEDASSTDLTESLTEIAPLDEHQQWLNSLPRGRQFGTQIHRFAEVTEFAQWPTDIAAEKFCRMLRLDEENITSMSRWLGNIVNTPLFAEDALCLSQIQDKDCLKELGFYINIRQDFDANAFNQALKAHHHLSSEPLVFEQIRGMLRGTMDLVFRHQGRYYLLDYKSNFLGETASAYGKEQLIQTICAQHYDWQYLIYCVALNRYLRERDPQYSYEQHFGGVLYAFLRGMDGQPQSGIFFDKPSPALMAALEEVF